jgi:hypothetical protein
MEAALGAVVMLLLVALLLVRLQPLTVGRVAVHVLTFVTVFASLLGISSLAFGIEFGFGSEDHWLATVLGGVAIGVAFPGSSSIAEWLLARYWPAQARQVKGVRGRFRRLRGPR